MNPFAVEDAQLLEKFANPDTQQYAFYQLVQSYQQPVYRLVRKMVISHDDADDLTQEVFIKLWHKLPTFRGEAQLFTWIYRIATNECLNFLKKKKRRFFIPLHDVAETLGQQLDHDPLFSGDEAERILQKAILTLPEKQRLVFHLKYFEEMPYKEMSDILGTSEGALKASYHHATKKIEEYLKQH